MSSALTKGKGKRVLNLPAWDPAGPRLPGPRAGAATAALQGTVLSYFPLRGPLVTPCCSGKLSLSPWPYPTSGNPKTKLCSASELLVPISIPFLTHVCAQSPSPGLALSEMGRSQNRCWTHDGCSVPLRHPSARPADPASPASPRLCGVHTAWTPLQCIHTPKFTPVSLELFLNKGGAPFYSR